MAIKGTTSKDEINPKRRRVDLRTFSQKTKDALREPETILVILVVLGGIGLVFAPVPFAGELIFLISIFVCRKLIYTIDKKSYDFPYRVPRLAHVKDGSSLGGKKLGEGMTLLGSEQGTKEQIYTSNIDLRAHQLIFGTTGSGKTELLLAIVANVIVQNSGLIYVDGKGDPKLQKDMFRLARRLGREDDLLLINFITSGRDFVDKQYDKVTNNMNMMGNTSSGMLIELIVALMDDSGGGGDMWKGRAISFVSALTRPLVYMRDKGFINLSPEKYLEYFELNVIEELVWEHNGRYGEMFDVILAPLKNYLITLPGYQQSKKKKQDTKTLEQHGYIVMQLTRTFNDLTFNYGHIFKTNVGDVDFYDVVINRRILVVLLPALERAPDSLKMLGKMIVGNIKQMMAGCLGNKVEGVVREIIESRPTNAAVPFYCILDEYGYYAVVGFAVAPAQARSLGFSITFAAQDFSSLKKSSAEEADATFENTNLRAIGRTTSGLDAETFKRLNNVAGEIEVPVVSGYESYEGSLGRKYRRGEHITFEKRPRIIYDDVAKQQDGEFVFIVGKKENKGKDGGVKVIHAMGFYTAGKTPKVMRLNDFLGVEPPEPHELPKNRKALQDLSASIKSGEFTQKALQTIEKNDVIDGFSAFFDENHTQNEKPILGSRIDQACGALGWYIFYRQNTKLGTSSILKPEENTIANDDEAKPIIDLLFDDKNPPIGLNQILANKLISDALNATPQENTEGDFIISAEHEPEPVTTNLFMSSSAVNCEDTFSDIAIPIINQHLIHLDASTPDYSDVSINTDRTPSNIKDMLRLEMITAGKPLESLEQKFDLEDRINEQRERIIQATTYIDPPIPDPQPISDLEKKLDGLKQRCSDAVKNTLNN